MAPWLVVSLLLAFVIGAVAIAKVARDTHMSRTWLVCIMLLSVAAASACGAGFVPSRRPDFAIWAIAIFVGQCIVAAIAAGLVLVFNGVRWNSRAVLWTASGIAVLLVVYGALRAWDHRPLPPAPPPPMQPDDVYYVFGALGRFGEELGRSVAYTTSVLVSVVGAASLGVTLAILIVSYRQDARGRTLPRRI